ncbi:MAG: hypothetical protein V4530_17680 [Pseudomonadota bacterium]
MDPVDIARQLIALATEAEAVEILIDDRNFTGDQEKLWLGELELCASLQRPSERMIEELREALRKTDWEPDLQDIPQSERDRWTWGEAIIFRGSEREIFRGSLVPTRRVPILRCIPDDVALYLISIDEGGSFLNRENHNMGWHYHYLDWRKDRSNVILSWDTRWKTPGSQTKTQTLRGLFVEPHGEKRNADFVARPDLWGPKKRISMYEACSPDLSSWPINQFKCASNNSDVVYPPNATLTPHPAAIAITVRKTAASAKRINKRRR